MYNPENVLPQEHLNLLMPYALPIFKACRVPQESINLIASYRIKASGANHLPDFWVPAHLGGWVDRMPTPLYIGHAPTRMASDADYALMLFFPLWEVNGNTPGQKIWTGIHIFLSENKQREIAGPLPRRPVNIDCRLVRYDLTLPYDKDKNLHLLPKWMTTLTPEVMPILACLLEVQYDPVMLGEPIPGE